MTNSNPKAIDQIGPAIPKNISTVEDARKGKLTIYDADHTESWIESTCYFPRSECQ